MGSRERQAVFNTLFDVRGLRVLDLFAGGGTLGIEALSRGAESAVFVDRSRQAVATIQENLATIRQGVERERMNSERTGHATGVVAQKVDEWAAEATEQFDLIFADPPYDDVQLDFLPCVARCLSRDGRFVLSIPKAMNAPEVEGLKKAAEKTYAGAKIVFYDKV